MLTDSVHAGWFSIAWSSDSGVSSGGPDSGSTSSGSSFSSSSSSSSSSSPFCFGFHQSVRPYTEYTSAVHLHLHYSTVHSVSYTERFYTIVALVFEQMRIECAPAGGRIGRDAPTS